MEHILSRKITRLREARHLTQGDLARHLGVSPSTVYKWEKGTTSPHSDFLPSLARLLEVSIDELYQTDERKELTRLVTRYSFDLEPVDTFYNILNQVENHLIKIGRDAELEYQLLLMKNIYLVNTAKSLVREADAFNQEYGLQYPRLEQQISIMRLKNMIFSLETGQVTKSCKDQVKRSPSLLHYHQLISICLFTARPEEALQYCKIAQQHFPKENFEHYLIDCHLALGQYEIAIRKAEDFLDCNIREGSPIDACIFLRVYNQLLQIYEHQHSYSKLLMLIEDGLCYLPEVYNQYGGDGYQVQFLQAARKRHALALFSEESEKSSAT